MSLLLPRRKFRLAGGSFPDPPGRGAWGDPGLAGVAGQGRGDAAAQLPGTHCPGHGSARQRAMAIDLFCSIQRLFEIKSQSLTREGFDFPQELLLKHTSFALLFP